MSSETLVNNGDGTITDTVTSLMWTAKTYKRLLSGQLVETGKGFTWEEANQLFGKGRKIPAENAPNDFTLQTYQGYKPGSESRISISGYNDWRLPTVEELKSLTNNYDVVYHGEKLDKIFESSFDNSIWGANHAGFVANRYDGAWAFFQGQGVCEMPTSETYAIRLVRDGNAYIAHQENSSKRKEGCSCLPIIILIFLFAFVIIFGTVASLEYAKFSNIIEK